MRILLCCWVAMLCAQLNSVGQDKTPVVRPLKVTDRVPIDTLSGMVSSNLPYFDLVSAKGRYIILDFFATWCGACISNLPKLQAIKADHRGKLEIFVVSYEPAEKMRTFIRKKEASGLNFIAGDSLLSAYFPHTTIPHVVILDPSKRVVAITSPSEVTQEKVSALLKGEEVRFYPKKDQIGFDRFAPLLEGGNGGISSDIRLRSTITRHLDGVASSTGVTYHNDSTIKRVYFLNFNPLMLYRFALSNIPPQYVRLENVDTARFINDHPSADWIHENYICYESMLPASTSDSACKAWMYQDLNRYFGLTGSYEIRNETVWVIKGLAEKDQSSANHLRPLQYWIKRYNNHTPGRPYTPFVVCDPALSDARIPLSASDIRNFENLKTAIVACGLRLEPEIRPMKLFILQQPNKTNCYE